MHIMMGAGPKGASTCEAIRIEVGHQMQGPVRIRLWRLPRRSAICHLDILKPSMLGERM